MEDLIQFAIHKDLLGIEEAIFLQTHDKKNQNSKPIGVSGETSHT
jgi:hypothetical protein